MNSFTSSSKPILWLLFGAILVGVYALILERILKIDESSYLSILGDDSRYLVEVDSVDVLLVGGSSTAFSISAKQLSEELDAEVYNLGRHASIDLRLYLTEIAEVLNSRQKNPVILVSPELYAFRPHDNFDKTNCMLFPYWEFSDFLRYGCLVENTVTALKILLRGAAQSDVSFYGSAYFNRFGDYEYPADFPRTSVQSDAPGNLGVMSKYLESTLLDDLKEIYPRVYFVPIVIPAFHCENSDFDSESFRFYIASANNEPRASYDFTVCGADELFLDTSYHVDRELRQKRTEEVSIFLRSIISREESSLGQNN